jgi:hypothetical protein
LKPAVLAADVGHPSTQLGSQLFGADFDDVAVAGRPGVIVSFQQIDTVAADQAVASPMRRLGM